MLPRIGSMLIPRTPDNLVTRVEISQGPTSEETMECLLNFEGLLMDFRVVIFETSRFYTQGKVKIELIHPPTISIAMLFTNVNMPDFFTFFERSFCIRNPAEVVKCLELDSYLLHVFCVLCKRVLPKLPTWNWNVL